MKPNILISVIHAAANHLVAALLFLIVSFCFPALLMADDVIQSLENNDQDRAAIRVVMSAAFVSDTGISVYDEILHYLGKKLQREVVFISGFSYATINSMLDSGMVDIGFICGLPYIMKKADPQPSVDLLLKPIYYSYVIVHKDSKFDSFLGLKGSTFVFADEISNSGYNMPRAHLINLGETSGFFNKILRSGSHEESIRMVALGEADVSAVDSLVYDYDQLKKPIHVAQTKIIKTLGPAGIPPVVISTKVTATLRHKIRDILLGMKNDPAGKKILDKALVDRFTIVDDSNYDGIRKMLKQAQDSGYQVIR